MNSKGNFRKVGVTLDGRNSYITAHRAKNNGKIIYPLKYNRQSEEPLKFKNFNLAKITAENIISKDKGRIIYKLTIGNKEYNFGSSSKVGKYYQLYDTTDPSNMIKYYIKETTEQKIRWIGYISLDNGYRERKDRNYGIERSTVLFSGIEQAIQKMILENNGIERVQKISEKEYVAIIKGSTAKIHIMHNASIMTINQRRKESGLKCIPFVKDVDKFLTSFIYISVDNDELKFFDSLNKALGITQQIIDNMYMLGTDYETIELVPVQFNGIISDDDINYKGEERRK